MLKVFEFNGEQKINQSLKFEQETFPIIRARCELMKQEIKRLKKMHFQLVKMIGKMGQFYMLETKSFIINFLSHIKKGKDCSFNQLRNQQKNTKVAFHSEQLLYKKIKKNQGLKNPKSLKTQIYQQFEAIKALQKKQNHLRQTNQKLNTLRKSISRERLLVPKKNEFETIYSEVDISFSQKRFFSQYQTQSLPIQQFTLTSPKFRQNKQNININYVQSAKNVNKISQKHKNKQNPVSTLFCPKGHEYYVGQVLMNLPHGKGKLRNCCPQIPLKIKSKVLEYQGNFIRGYFDGFGVMKCKGQIRFEGEFKGGMRNGQGVIYLNGMREKGQWQKDELKSKF